MGIIYFSSSWIQEFFQESRAEQVEQDELEKLLHGQLEATGKFLVRKGQINCQGRVNRDQDRVFRIADKRS